MSRREGRLDAMVVRVERHPEADPPAAASAGDALATLIKNNLGVSVGVDVVEPDGIERSMGKMRRTIDERPAH